MKKFLISIIIVVFLIGYSNVKPVEATELVLPDYLQAFEDEVNKRHEEKRISITDYREDDSTIWIWIDNKTMPLDCDYVVVLKIVNKKAGQYKVLEIINWDTSPDPCKLAYEQYEKYLKGKSKER